jgi:hypothetical protein
MRPLRNLANELVERRLWPVALLLALALVAVPLLLSKPASPADDGAPDATMPAQAPAAAAAAAARTPGDTPPGGEPVVAVAQADQPNAPLRGRAKNPFRQQHTQDAVTSGGSAPSAGAAGSPSGAGSDGSGGTSGGTGGSGGSGGTGGGEPQPTFEYASIDVRFGRAGHRLRTIEDVPRLAPLPNASHPIVVFLGMRRDRERAVFLVSTDVHVQGLGQCVPSQKLCEAIELRRGETAFFDYTRADGDVEQYELDLDDVTLHTTASKAVAQRAYARVSRVGKLLVGGGSVHSSVTGVARKRRLPFHYAEGSGVLHIAPWASRRARKARAHGAVSEARLADLPRAGW